MRPAPPSHAFRGASTRAPGVAEVLESVVARRFSAEYQPIVEVRRGAVVAHEALSRFFDVAGSAIAPSLAFAELRGECHSLLLRVELELKRFQIRHAPPGRLFVNVDPGGFEAARRGSRNLLTDVIRRAGRARVVVEAVESRCDSEARMGRSMLAALHAAGVPVALDDVGAPDAVLSLDALRQADVLKLDRAWLAGAGDAGRIATLEVLVGLARRMGKPTVLEGVESARDLELASELGIDWAQGFLFRERFRTARFPSAPGQRAAA